MLFFPFCFFFRFRSKLYKCKFWRHCEIPWGVARLRFVTPVLISANHITEQTGLPGLVLSKQSSFHPEKRPFFRMIEFTPSHLASERKFFARCGHRTRKATFCTCLSFVTAKSVFAWVERVCARFIDIWRHMCVYGFCYWLIDLWPIKRYASGRGADRRTTLCARYVTGSL